MVLSIPPLLHWRTLLGFPCVATVAALLGVSPVTARPLASTATTVERQDQLKEARGIVDLMQNLHYSARRFRDIGADEMSGAPQAPTLLQVIPVSG